MKKASELRAQEGHRLRRPARMAGSEWADRHFLLSPESHGQVARWTTAPYQREWLDSFTDPDVEQVTLMGSSRVGKTKCLIDIPLGIIVDTDPGPVMVVEPTLDLANDFSRDEFEPMVRDCPQLRGKVLRGKAKVSLRRKQIAGGFVVLRGANSAAGLASKTIRDLFLDEVDRYPPSAGDEGDPVLLAIRRTQTFARRKVVAVSTPGVDPSRIEDLYLAGDQRRYLVPCPHCGVLGMLAFGDYHNAFIAEGEVAHRMTWPEGQPERAHFVCGGSGCLIEEHHRSAMVAEGYWHPMAPWAGRRDRQHRSYIIWSAYSESPGASWIRIAVEYEAVKGDPEKLRTFVNTMLGVVWRVVGDAPPWMPLYLRREKYRIGTVPQPVEVLTCGVDVQGNRLVYELVGWGRGYESWSVEYGEFAGDPASPSSQVWRELDRLLASTWPREDGAQLAILLMGIDSGWNTQVVYSWARGHPDRVMATKGSASSSVSLSAPRRVTVTMGGRQIVDGCKLWIIGSSVLKRELYGYLRLPPPKRGEPAPAGYCHWPEYPEPYFEELTAEHEVEIKKRTGHRVRVWVLPPGKQNHVLDVRVIARAVAATAQVDGRLRARPTPPSAPPPALPTPAARDPWSSGRPLDGRRNPGSSGSIWRRR